MDIRKKLLVAGTVGVLGLGAFGAAGAAQAQTAGQTNLVDKIASTFNLNKAEVQKVFDQNRTEQGITRETKQKQRLTQAVTDGKITQAQMDKIIAKQAELKASREVNRESMQDKTDEERKSTMKAERDALTQWAKDNGISEDYLRGIGGPGGGRGHGGPSGERPADAPTE